jgi:dihydroneopterin aldolase
MISIALHDAEFFAWHGFYPEEQLLGNRFMVDIEVGFTPVADLSEDDIGHTINYEQLYTIAYEEMKITRKLIETVAQAIIDEVKTQFPFVEHIHIAIKKLNPALKGKVAYSSVVINYAK